MKTGLEISKEMLDLQALLDSDNIDFDNPQVQELICSWAQALDEERISKTDNICALIRNLLNRASFRKEEADRLHNRAKVDENHARSLKNYLRFLMETWGMQRMETPRFSLAISGNGGKCPLEIAPEFVSTPEMLPERFQVKRIDIDKEAIRAELEAGKKIPGCRLLERGESLRIR